MKYRITGLNVQKSKLFNSEKSAVEYYKNNCRRSDFWFDQNAVREWVEYNGVWEIR